MVFIAMTQDQKRIQKPVAEIVRPEITRIPKLTIFRRITRWLLIHLLRILIWLFINKKVTGIENIPREGPALVVTNHLGDADLILGAAATPRTVETFVKSELRDFPVLGHLLEAYGVIWIHSGRPDRRAIRAALQVLEEGRIIGIAPEGRESLSGALEEGTNGAAYIAIKANVPILPLTFTGTENQNIFPNMKRFRRSHITITIGQPFNLPPYKTLRTGITSGTETIMQKLASQLPICYRGVYKMTDEVYEEDKTNTSEVDPHGCK